VVVSGLEEVARVLVAVGLLGAGIQDAWERKVYDLWWVPVLSGGALLFVSSDPATLPLRAVLIATVGVWVVWGFDRGTPLADRSGTLALVLTTGDLFVVAFPVALVAFYLTKWVTKQKQLPWVTFVLLGWAITLLF
jgi:hypothetical protein